MKVWELMSQLAEFPAGREITVIVRDIHGVSRIASDLHLENGEFEVEVLGLLDVAFTIPERK